MSDPKTCIRCGRVGHRSNKCPWPAWRKPRETPAPTTNKPKETT